MLERVPCPVCKNKEEFLPVKVPNRDDHIHSYGKIYEGYTKSIWKVCGKCGFVHQNPRPSVATLNAYYKESKYHGDVYYDRDELLKDYQPVAYGHEIPRLVADTGIKQGSVFDLGCGLGFALKDFRDEHGWECYGIEPDNDKSAFAIKQLELKNVTQGMFNAKTEIKGGKKVDLVFSHHVWEHIADFDEVLKGIPNILKRGGYFFASMPTYFQNRSNMSKLYMNSAHYSSFTHNAMSNLLARHGFEYVKHYYYNRAGLGVTDDLQYLAKYTGKRIDAHVYFEDPKVVQRYVNTINPLRSIFFAPIYSARYFYAYSRIRYVYWQGIKNFFRRVGYLRNPSLFVEKVRKRLSK